MTATNKKATSPLAAIRLEYDPVTDELYAKGVYGTDRFNDFFKAYKKELLDEYGRGLPSRMSRYLYRDVAVRVCSRTRQM